MQSELNSCKTIMMGGDSERIKQVNMNLNILFLSFLQLIHGNIYFKNYVVLLLHNIEHNYLSMCCKGTNILMKKQFSIQNKKKLIWN